MNDLLNPGALFEGLGPEGRQQLSASVRHRTLATGQYLFTLGDDATDFFVVVKGNVDLCFPMRIGGALKDVAIESIGVGESLGWSALVKPYRFTVSARASEPSAVACLARRDLQAVFETDVASGFTFLTRITEVMGVRLIRFQALWVRELQRTLEHEVQRHAPPPA